MSRNIAEDIEEQRQHLQALEGQICNLTIRYVAASRLHASVDRETVLKTIQEIVIDLIGSADVSIFEAVAGSDEFRLVSSYGVDPARLRSFRLSDGRLSQTLRRGAVYSDDAASRSAEKITACVPLKIEDRLIGAILIFRLLDSGMSLQQFHYEIFDLLGIHASTALYCAMLHERA